MREILFRGKGNRYEKMGVIGNIHDNPELAEGLL